MGASGGYRAARRAAGRGRRWVDDHRPVRVRSACYAPHSALYFRPDGGVKACCATAFDVGWVTGEHRRSLREIWDGTRLAAQRHALEAGRFDLGCQECELAVEQGDRKGALASDFDRWRRGAPYDGPRLLDFALSNRCNLACVMCDGELSSTIRAQREHRPPLAPAYDDRFFDELRELLPHVDRVQFKGGEPFLAPENRRVWDLMIELGVDCETLIITNGTIWTDRVEHYLEALRPEITVSVDAVDPAVLAATRVGADAAVVWANIDRFATACGAAGRPLTLNFCLMTGTWRELPAFLREVERRQVRGHVILVNQPYEYDVLRLPAAELAAVRAGLVAAGRPEGSITAGRCWDSVITRIDAQLEHPVTLTVRAPAEI